VIQEIEEAFLSRSLAVNPTNDMFYFVVFHKLMLCLDLTKLGYGGISLIFNKVQLNAEYCSFKRRCMSVKKASSLRSTSSQLPLH